MARSNFDLVMLEIFAHEGGYVDHPRDPGGATNMGITHKTLAAYRGKPVTKADVRNLTKAEAREIYRLNYWNKIKGDALPYGYDLVAMDGGVNSGPSRGVKWMQRGAGAAADGRVGPQTLEACRSAGPKGIERACEARMGFLQGLRTWDAFGRGWSRRVASVEAVALRMHLRAAGSTQEARTWLEGLRDALPGKAADERRAGTAQTTATGAGGAGGVSVADLPPAAVVALALGVATVAALLFIRSRRKATYHEDRAEALSAELEALT